MKVLIVEDERITRDQLSLLLREWGYEVLTAEDGSHAWDIYRNEAVRLVVTDILMPGVDGIELCKRIRGIKREHYTYILVITGMSDQKSLFDAMFAGADDFIVKPWHNSEVRARLRTGERIIHLEDELRDRIKKLEEANQIIKSANERMMREVAFMSRMQSTMLPCEKADYPGIEYAWKHQPRSVMAGDGMNFFRLDEFNYAVVLADVAAAGDAASFLLGSLARKMVPIPGQPGILKLLSRKAPGYEIVAPAKVLAQLRTEFPLDLQTGHHFSVFYGILNVAQGTFCYSSAGMPAPLQIKRNGKISSDECCDEPIGKGGKGKYEQFKILLEKKDRLLFYTDGLTRTLDNSGEAFVNRRLREMLRKRCAVGLEELVEELFDSAQNWGEPPDNTEDTSVLLIEYSGVSENGA